MNTLTDSLEIPQIASVSDLQKGYASLIARSKKGNKPLLILRNNKLEAILLNPELYKDLVARAQKIEKQEVAVALSVYHNEKKLRKLKKMKSVDELFA